MQQYLYVPGDKAITITQLVALIQTASTSS